MNITIEQLIACVQNATKKLDVAYQSDDYYATRGELSTTEIEYVDPDSLIYYLRELKNESA